MRRSNVQWDVRAVSAHAGLFHFLYSCGRACLLPFLTLYLRHLGLTAAMVGIAMATRCLIALAWGGAASLLAERYGRRRAVVLGSLLCSAAVAPLLLLLPPADAAAAAARCNATRLWGSDAAAIVAADLDPGRPGNFTPPAAGGSPTAMMSLPVSLSPGGAPASETTMRSGSNRSEDSRRVSEGPPKPMSSGSPGKTQVAFSGRNGSYSSLPERGVRSVRRGSKQGLEEKEKDEDEEKEKEETARSEFLGSLKVMDAQHQLFFLVLMGVALWEGVAAPLERTVDDGLYEYLDFVDAADRHGWARLWGLLGASAGVFGAGLLVAGLGCTTVGGGGRLPGSSAHFFAYALLTALAVPAATFLPACPGRKRAPAGQALKALRQVRRDPGAALGAATAFLAGAASSAVADFLLWQMQDQGSGELHMGVALGVALLSQLLFLTLVAPRAARFRCHGAALSAGAAALGLQCLYYSFLWSPWSALPAQALSCLSAGALWWAAEARCEAAATPGTERWARAAARELAGGLGAALGSLGAGFTVERFGAAAMFRAAAAVLLLWALGLPAVLSRLPRRQRINYSRLLAAGGGAAEQSESESDADAEQEGDWLVRAMQDDRSANNNNNNNDDDDRRHWVKKEKRRPI